MCSKNRVCEIQNQVLAAWRDSVLPAMAGVGLMQGAMAQVLTLSAWDETSFRGAEWAHRGVRISVNGEALGEAIAGLLLRDAFCKKRLSAGFMQWCGVYAGQELDIIAALAPPAGDIR